jgi:hypothetical protein
VDALDQSAVLEQFRLFRPDAIVHQLTALSAATDLRAVVRDFDRVFAQTNLLRTRGTDNLLAAGPGCRRKPIRRAELLWLALRASRRPGKDRG